MSDYLGNLVAKSFDLAEVIQPRPVSLFEPPPVAGWLASAHPFGLETIKDEPAYGETAFDIPSLASPPVGYPLASPPPVIGLRSSPDAGQQQSGDLSATPGWLPGQPTAPPPPIEKFEIANRKSEIKWPLSQPATEPAPASGAVPVLLPAAAQPSVTREPGQPNPDWPTLAPAAARDATGAAPPRSAAQSGQHRPTLEPATQQSVIEQAISPAAPPPIGASSAETEATPSPGTSERESRTPLEPTIPRPEPSPIPAVPTPVVARPHVTPYIGPAAPTPAESAATPEPTPTVQVTIGRVEVRATPPPPPAPKKRRSKPPVMSLDEYLRQRAGGDRR